MKNTPSRLKGREGRPAPAFDLFPDAPRTAAAEGVERADLVDLKLVKHRETDKALLLAKGLDGRKAQWIAKRLVEAEGDIFTMPRWAAVEKGWV